MLTPITLHTLLAHDPARWPTQPHRRDYTAFRLWAIARYGRGTWNLYIRDHS